MSLRNQVMQDAKQLHSELQRLGVDAGIDPRRCTPGGDQLAFYGVRLGGKTKAADVAKILPELQRVISRSRRTRTHLRFDDMLLRLEAEHPNVKPLDWLPSLMRGTRAHCATLGMSYHDGNHPVSFSFDDVPQVLVAGETGSGKTVLVRNIITSLCYATSPDDLRIVLIDPKNEDLLPYRSLPHVMMFAGMPSDVSDAIDYVLAEVQARIADPSRKPYRLLLVVDELAQLTNINSAIKKLGDIMSIGRSKLVNCLVCTQQPTEDGGMGSMMKANVPLRLIGAVSAGQSYTATRRKGAGADMLPGNGSFLFIRGMELYRFQSFYLNELDERKAIALIRDRWGSATTTHTDSDFTRVSSNSSRVVVAQDSSGIARLATRDEIDDIADTIADMWRDGASKRAMAQAALGRPYAGSYAAKIDAAIDRLESRESEPDSKIIRLRRAG